MTSPLPDLEEIFDGYEQALVLLSEWFEAWENDERFPATLPDSLQVRTALFLASHRDDFHHDGKHHLEPTS